MMKSQVLVCAWIFFKVVRFITGSCDLPTEVRGVTWFSHYDNSLTWVVNYSDSVYLYSVTNIREVVTAGFTCLHSELGSTGHHQLLLQNDRRRYCLRVVSTGPALLVLFTPVPDSVSTGGQCSDRFSDTEISWQVGYPLSRVHQACPFSNGGVYQAEVVKDDVTFCRGDALSVVTVDGSGELLMNTCVQTNDYSWPVHGAHLRCVSHADGYGVGGGHPLLLLAYDDGQVTRFYCARYMVDGKNVHLSLDTDDANTASCRQGMTADTSTSIHIAFRLTSVSTSWCGCVYGTCTDVPVGGHRCLCEAGYTDVHCQTELPRGRCGPGNSPCMNGASCTEAEPGFYYCRCPYGFTGIHCNDIHGCEPNPCVNGGECVARGSGRHQCMCRSPYRGPNCEVGGDAHLLTGSDDQTAVTLAGGGGGPSTLVIVLVTVTGGVLVAALAIAVVVCQRRLKKKHAALPENLDGDELPKQSSSMQAWRPDYKQDVYSDLATTAAETKQLDD